MFREIFPANGVAIWVGSLLIAAKSRFIERRRASANTGAEIAPVEAKPAVRKCGSSWVDRGFFGRDED